MFGVRGEVEGVCRLGWRGRLIIEIYQQDMYKHNIHYAQAWFIEALSRVIRSLQTSSCRFDSRQIVDIASTIQDSADWLCPQRV